MLPAYSHPLNQTDLLRLDAFLHSSACGREAMGLSRAHGFLTAAASGPEQLEPGEWLRLVFDEPVFETGEQAEDMLGLAMRLYREIETTLDGAGSYRPVLDFVRDNADGVAVDATAWCRGYFSGMSLCRELWSMHAGGGLNHLLAPIYELARYRGAARDGNHRRLCERLPGSAESVYRYWRAQAHRHAL
jgi:yecA family protein